MPKIIYMCILLIYFKVISKKGGHYCPRLPIGLGVIIFLVFRPNIYVGRNLWICAIHGYACAIYGSIVCAEIHGCLRNLWILRRMQIISLYSIVIPCWHRHIIDRLATSTNFYNRRNRITDCRRRNSVEHGVMACSFRKITIIRHVRFVPG